MLKYSDFTDEELITLLREGDAAITDYLMEKYKNTVRLRAASMFILGGDKDDLIQEGMIGLYKAIRDYDSGRDASFRTFAELCVSRQVYTAIEASRRMKHQPLNSYISIYGETDDEGHDDNSIIDLLQSVTDRNPEDLLIDRENSERLQQKIYEELSPFERQVLNLRVTGMGYTEIAKVLGKDDKSTDNAIQRIKAKVKKIITEEI